MKNARSLTALLISVVLLLSACSAPSGPQPDAADAPTDVPTDEQLEEQADLLLEQLQLLPAETVQLSDTITFSTPAPADISYDGDAAAMFINNTLLVFATVGADRGEIEMLAEQAGASIVGETPALDLYQFRFDAAMDLEGLRSQIESLESSDLVEAADIDYLMDISDSYAPNDPWHDSENPDPQANRWGIEAIRAEEAWEYLNYMTPVTIGLMEEVTSTTHQDLSIRAVINASAASAVTSTYYAHADMANHDHGTHVAGTMAAIPGNGIGITGVCAVPGTNVLICNDWGNISVGHFMSAITTMVTVYDVRVINISQSSCQSVQCFAASHGVKDAQNALAEEAKTAQRSLQRLLDSGHEFVLCIAAGNDNNTAFYKDSTAQFDMSMRRTYGYTSSTYAYFAGDTAYYGADARYSHYLSLIEDEDIRNRIIVVGNAKQSTDGGYESSFSSNVGLRVDIMAPGRQIYSLDYEGEYRTMSGTSMATPHVSGVAAMLFACDPSLTGAQVKDYICSTADRTYSLRFTDVDAGMLRADRAVEAVLIDLGHLPKPTIPTAWDLVQMIHEDIRFLCWDSSYSASSGQSSVGFSEEFTWGDGSYAFTFDLANPRGESMPNYLHVRDNQGGGCELPITVDVYTGMTYEEIVAEGAAVTGPDENNQAKLYLPGWTVTLIFEGGGNDAVLIAAKFHPAEDEPQPGDSAALHALPTMTDMMQMSRDTVRTIEWDSIWETESGIDAPSHWTNLMCEWKESSYSFTWNEGYTYPSTCYVTDFLSGGLALPITDCISTGMTYAEIQAVESVSDLESFPIGYGCFFYPEQGCCITLFFDGDSSDAVLTSAEIVYFE